jgi:ABC-type multidrug transport system fused ATPase/permease subunit
VGSRIIVAQVARMAGLDLVLGSSRRRGWDTGPRDAELRLLADASHLKRIAGSSSRPIAAPPARLDNPCMIEIEHVTKRYGDKVAVDDLSFSVKPGIVTGVSGAERRREVDDDAADAWSRPPEFRRGDG